jgi:cation:H+ antiporter
MAYLLILIGLVALLAGAYLLVRGGGSLALKLGISELTVGLTIVALGTSAPELVVSVLADYSGAADLALGNVIGSNITNILLILGITSLLKPLNLQRTLRWREIPFTLMSCLVLLVMCNDGILTGSDHDRLGRVDGLVLLFFLALFLYYVFSVARQKDHEVVGKVSPVALPLALLMVIAGVVSLALGGEWVLQGASKMAAALGMSQALIGLTIVAVGTSLPELATSALAAWRGNADLAVGNVVGSNILNIFWVLGVSSIISPIGFIPALNLDLLVMLLATVLFFIFTYTGHRNKIDKAEGALFLCCYLAYLVYAVYRG